MVGADGGHHHVGEREEEEREQRRVQPPQLHVLPQRAVDEDGRVDRGEEQDDGHEVDGEVVVERLHQPFVHQVHGVEESEVERMADGLEVDAHAGDGDPRPAVVTRHAVVLGEDAPEAAWRTHGVPAILAGDEQGLQGNEHQQDGGRQPPLLFLYQEYLERVGHLGGCLHGGKVTTIP